MSSPVIFAVPPAQPGLQGDQAMVRDGQAALPPGDVQHIYVTLKLQAPFHTMVTGTIPQVGHIKAAAIEADQHLNLVKHLSGSGQYGGLFGVMTSQQLSPRLLIWSGSPGTGRR